MGGSQRIWICTTKNANCKAKLQLDDEGYIVKINNVHTHPSRKYVQAKDGTYIAV
jgi:hypothetical protein